MKNDIDHLMRYAIWNTYKQQCVYCGRFIKILDNAQVDHIIPKSTSPIGLAQKKERYKLWANFTIDSIENLILSCANCNRQKSGTSLMESNERYFLDLAHRKKTIVETHIEEILNNLKQGRLNTISEEQQKTINDKYDTLEKEKSLFNINREIVDGAPNQYINSTPHVALIGFIPSKFVSKGACNIEFHSNHIMISLTHNDIMVLIEQYQNDKLEQYLAKIDDTKKVFMVIRGYSAFIEYNIFKEIIKLLTDFLETYHLYYLKFIEFIGGKQFKQYNDSNDYILMDLSIEQWIYLLKYSQKYDIGNGKGEKYCFNNRPNSIIALSQDQKNTYVKFIVKAVQEINEYFDPYNINNSLHIVWELPSPENLKRIEQGKVFTAKQTYNYLSSILNYLEP